jgi:hypothetical protein
VTWDRDVATLILAQVGAALVCLAPAWVLGACAGWVPAVGTVLASFFVHLWIGQRRPGWLDRARVRTNSLGSAFVHAPILGGTYALLWFLYPDWFGFGWNGVLVLAPVLGLGGGAVALALTLAGGDAAAAAVGASLDAERRALVTEPPRVQREEEEEPD